MVLKMILRSPGPGNAPISWKCVEGEDSLIFRMGSQAGIVNTPQLYFVPDLAIYPAGMAESANIVVSYSAIERMKRKHAIYLVNPKVKKLLQEYADKNAKIMMHAEVPAGAPNFAFLFAIFLAESIITMQGCEEGEKLEKTLSELKGLSTLTLRKSQINLTHTYQPEEAIKDKPEGRWSYQKIGTSKSIAVYNSLMNVYDIMGQKLGKDFENFMDEFNGVEPYENVVVGPFEEFIRKKAVQFLKATQWAGCVCSYFDLA